MSKEKDTKRNCDIEVGYCHTHKEPLSTCPHNFDDVKKCQHPTLHRCRCENCKDCGKRTYTCNFCRGVVN